MFADTITFTDIHGTEDYVLNRINQDKYSSEYLLVTDTKRITLRIRNTTRYDKTLSVSFDRHNVELTEQVYAVSPATVGIVRKAYFTFEVQQGDVLATNVQCASALASWLTATSNANLTKLAGFES